MIHSIKILIVFIVCLSSSNLNGAMARTNGTHSPKYRVFLDYISSMASHPVTQRNFTCNVLYPEYGRERFDNEVYEQEPIDIHCVEQRLNNNVRQSPGLGQVHQTNINHGGGWRKNDHGCQCPGVSHQYKTNVNRGEKRRWNDNVSRYVGMGQESDVEIKVSRGKGRRRNGYGSCSQGNSQEDVYRTIKEVFD